LRTLLFLFSIIALSAENQCIVCHKAESHYRGKGDVLKRWQSVKLATERTGHAWIPASEFKRFSRKFSAWDKPRESFYSALKTKALSEVAKVIRYDLEGYDNLARRLENDDRNVLEILQNPFHTLQLKTSQKKSYRTTIESRIRKVLLVFGGTRERLEGIFELMPLDYNNEAWRGEISLDRWGAKKVFSSGSFRINNLGELKNLSPHKGTADPLLQNCAWIFQRPKDLNIQPVSFERPIALETGRVLKQREMQARVILDDFSVTRDLSGVYMNVSYSLESAANDKQVRLLGGQGIAKLNLSGVLLSAHARLDLSVRAFGISLKANMEQWIDLVKP
tara:strand:- start:3058 stop:4062 length:1005 start_codon:yes stop_codon:yes gene_type:complete